ncbi:hypothetical protein, partial [Salmonella sp. s23851]
SDTGINMISSITEVSTCKYMLVFSTPILCKHPLFHEETPRFLVIHCEEMPAAPEEDGGVLESTNSLLPSGNIKE